MNEHQLRRLLRRLAVLSAPLPLAMLGAACGSSSSSDPEGGAGTTAEAGKAGEGSAGAAHQAGAGSGGSSSAGAGTGGSVALAGAAGSVALAGAGGKSSECNSNIGFNCGPTNATVPKKCVSSDAVVGSLLSPTKCVEICNAFGSMCSVTALAATTVTVQCMNGCQIGRRPAGLDGAPLCDMLAVGGYFAEIAHLEAASVTAFRILRDELRENGAPKKLVRAAARAARDEIRHTRATGALARRYGTPPRLPTVAPRAHRSLEAMAIENAVEGCVRETYGALLATRQAELAQDPLVRAAMMRIARDETQHAALSWRVARWLDTRLDPSAKRNVERAQRAAANGLLEAVAHENTLSFADLAGLPSPTEAARLAAEMNQALWS